MDILFLLVPISIVFVGLGVWFFFWAVKSGQFEDMEGPAHKILMDDEKTGAAEKSRVTEECEKKSNQ